MSILKYIKNPFKGLLVSRKKEEEGMTKMYNQTGDNDIVRIIELTNDAGRLKKVEEFCGENLPTLIKIDDGVLYCHEELSLLTVGDCIVRDSEGLLLHYDSKTIRKYYNLGDTWGLDNQWYNKKNILKKNTG